VTDFRGLMSALVRAQVEFIIIGGAAAVAHGSARLTQDLDIVYRRTPENISRLVRALSPHQPYLRGAPPGLPFAWNERTLLRGMNFTLATTLGDLDLFGEITGGGGHDDLLPDTVRIEVFGTICLCLSLRRLIQVKRAAGRPRDLEAIAELEVILEERARQS
jgi:predicted nucleotidyltransferase